MSHGCPRASRQHYNGQTDRQYDGRFAEYRQFYQAAQLHSRLADRRCHVCLLSLRTCSISARNASSSSSVQFSCFSNAVTVWRGEPPKKVRTSLLMALRWATARDFVGE